MSRNRNPQHQAFFFVHMCSMLFLAVPPALVCTMETSATRGAGPMDGA